MSILSSKVYRHRMSSSEMLILPFLVALGVIFYCLAAANYYFDSNYTTYT